MEKERILFICSHNSARSQMAEEILRKYRGDRYEVWSAGLEAGPLNPHAVRILREEEDLDIAGKETRSVREMLALGVVFSRVITVCSQAEKECPIFPGIQHREFWPFPDPAGFQGTEEEIREKTREVYQAVKEKVLAQL